MILSHRPSFIHRRPLSLLRFPANPIFIPHIIISFYYVYLPTSSSSPVGRWFIHTFAGVSFLLLLHIERVEHPASQPARHKKTWRTESRRKEKRIIQGRFGQLKRHIREELKSKTTERNSSVALLLGSSSFTAIHPSLPYHFPLPPLLTAPWEYGNRRRKSNCTLGISSSSGHEGHGEREMHSEGSSFDNHPGEVVNFFF